MWVITRDPDVTDPVSTLSAVTARFVIAPCHAETMVNWLNFDRELKESFVVLFIGHHRGTIFTHFLHHIYSWSAVEEASCLTQALCRNV